MQDLTKEQTEDCQSRIDQANKEIAEVCKRLQVEPVITDVKLAMGDLRYRGIESPLPLNELVNNEPNKED